MRLRLLSGLLPWLALAAVRPALGATPPQDGTAQRGPAQQEEGQGDASDAGLEMEALCLVPEELGPEEAHALRIRLRASGYLRDVEAERHISAQTGRQVECYQLRI